MRWFSKQEAAPPALPPIPEPAVALIWNLPKLTSNERASLTSGHYKRGADDILKPNRYNSPGKIRRECPVTLMNTGLSAAYNVRIRDFKDVGGNFIFERRLSLIEVGSKVVISGTYGNPSIHPLTLENFLQELIVRHTEETGKIPGWFPVDLYVEYNDLRRNSFIGSTRIEYNVTTGEGRSIYQDFVAVAPGLE